MTYAVGAIVVLAIAAFLLVRKSRYYGRIFGEAHYAEIVRWASAMIIGRHPVEEPSTTDGTAVVTSAGVALAYTSVVNEGRRSVHFSVGQTGGYTTGAVGRRVLFLLIRLLHQNRCEAHLFQAESTVYHAVFSMPADAPWTLAPAETAVGDAANCPPQVFQALPIAQQTVADAHP